MKKHLNRKKFSEWGNEIYVREFKKTNAASQRPEEEYENEIEGSAARVQKTLRRVSRTQVQITSRSQTAFTEFH